MPTLDFKGKQIVYAHHLTVSARTLEVDTEKSHPPKDHQPSLDDNLIIHGDNLPDYDTLARHLVYTATGHAPATIRKARSKDGLFHETDDRLFYLLYEPDLAFLRSADSALNGERAERIAKQAKTKKKTALVFATHKFMGQKELTEMGIVFCGLPYVVN